jgi:hypothetical protein
MYTCIYTYTYIYTHREKERTRFISGSVWGRKGAGERKTMLESEKY